MKNEELTKFKIISHLWEIVKLANDEELANFDIVAGIPDGDTPEENAEMVTNDFKAMFQLYGGLAIEALKSGLYIGDEVFNVTEDYSEVFTE